MLVVAWWALSTGALACADAGTIAMAPVDASVDVRGADGAGPDASMEESGGGDASVIPPDATSVDAPVDALVDAGPPSLVALGVSAATSADASPSLALVPPFSPEVHDYVVHCAPGTNVLTVSMTASAGASSLLVQPIASPALPQQTLSVSVTENQALVAVATDGVASVEYWVRCLPHDFPLMQWTPHPDAGTPPPGYYLLGSGLFLGPDELPVPPTSGCFAMVLDRNGVPVWYSRAPWANGNCVFDVDSVVGGTISFDSILDAPPQFEVHQLDPLGTTAVAAHSDAGVLNVDLHELRLLPNGDFLVISSPAQSGVDLTGMIVPLLDGGVETLSGPQTILACDVLEVAPDGAVVWSWTATDHFDAVADSLVPVLTPAGPFGNSLVDPFHCNSVDVDPGTGNLLVSAREMNSIFYVEKSTGRVLWKMGGAEASKDGATYVSVADPFAEQHDARFQPDWSAGCNGSGHISLFDDESYLPNPARAVVYDVVVGAPDGGACGDAGAAGTATVSWQRKGATSSFAMGSFRILPDGSRVIGWGLIPGAGFTEVDSSGNDLLDLTFSDGNLSYRALKVEASAFDLGALRSTAGLP
jgi:hypothetical protein